MTLRNLIYHSCRRVDELLSQAMDEPLGLLDQMRMRMHLRMCRNCPQVEKQLKTLHELGADIGGLEASEDLAEWPIPEQAPTR
jgi:hypothetical protein